MAEETKFVRALVSIKELRKGMQITSYVGFNKKYESMNEETCTFTRHNFRNARARIIRGGKELDVQVNQIAVGDTLSRIYKLPPELKKLTNVNEKLAQALMQRGFLKFEVKKTSPIPGSVLKTAPDKKAGGIQTFQSPGQ